MPMTAPNVSRRGTREGAAAPVGDVPSALGAGGIDVALDVAEVAMAGTSVLAVVVVVVVVGPLVPVLEADASVLLGSVAVDASDEDGLSR